MYFFELGPVFSFYVSGITRKIQEEKTPLSSLIILFVVQQADFFYDWIQKNPNTYVRIQLFLVALPAKKAKSKTELKVGRGREVTTSAKRKEKRGFFVSFSGTSFPFSLVAGSTGLSLCFNRYACKKKKHGGLQTNLAFKSQKSRSDLSFFWSSWVRSGMQLKKCLEALGNISICSTTYCCWNTIYAQSNFFV